MNGRLKSRIQTAIEKHSKEEIIWLVQLANENERARALDPAASTHDILCEIAEQIVHRASRLVNPKDKQDFVEQVFGQLYDLGRQISAEDRIDFSRVDFANLPVRNGRRILDYEREYKSHYLIKAIESRKGDSSPVKLNTPGAQDLFFKWQELDNRQKRRKFFESLAVSRQVTHNGREDSNRFVIESLKFCAFTKDDYRINEMTLYVSWDDFSAPDIEEIKTLEESAVVDENYEVAGALSNFTKKYLKPAPAIHFPEP